MTRDAVFAIGFTAALAAGGCAGGVPDGPPAIRYGEAACEACRMLVSEPRFAAAARASDGEPLVFDSIGCLLRYEQARAVVVRHRWVHDYETGQWVDAAEAWFVHSRDLMTPMGDGVVALADQARAEALAAGHRGRILRFGALPRLLEGGMMETAQEGP